MSIWNSLFKNKKEQTIIAPADSSDYITGLLNRREGELKIKAAMAQAPGCLAFIDLDNLKPINDTYGHLAGDHAIRVVSDVLKVHGQEAIIARIGGDEFLFYMNNVDEGKANFIIGCIMESFRNKRENDPYLRVASLSIGLCLSTPDSNYTDIYQCADKALYYIKQNGKDAYYFYHQAFSSVKQSPSVDLGRLVESIRRQGSYSGALGVDFREFTHLYEFINNMAIRYEHNLQLIMITIEPYSSTKGEFAPEILEDAMTHMNTAIRGSLRSVDVCTRFSNQQFLVILTNAELQNIEMIVKRIFEQFYQLCDNKNLHLHYEAADLKDT